MSRFEANSRVLSFFVVVAGGLFLIEGGAQASSLGGLRETKSLIGSLVNVGVALTVVIMLLYAFVYLLKKSGISQGGASNSKIKVLETKMVAPKKYIAIVDVAGKIITIGITEQNISLLTELGEESVRDLQNSSALEVSSKINKSFGAILHRVIGKNISGGESS